MKVVLLLLLALVMAKEDYYQLLGVDKKADKQAIKKAFKRLSLKLHPDKNRNNKEQAKEKFAKVVNAYEVLKDDEKRKVYDKYGEEGLARQSRGEDPAGQQHFGGRGGFDGFEGFQGFGGGFDDFFGGGGGGQHFHFQQGGQGQQWQEEEPSKPEPFKNSDVLDLDMSQLSKFYRRDNVWVVLLFKSNKKFDKIKDVIKEMAEKFYGIFQVAAVDCDFEEELCDEEFQPRKFPEIQVLKSNLDSKAYIYNGPMESGRIAGYAVQFMDSFVSYVSPQNYQEFLRQEGDKTKVILFTSKKTTPPLLKALSKELKGKLVFGEVRNGEPAFLKQFGVTQLPTLRVLTRPYDFAGDDYVGEYKKDQLMKFLREYAYSKKKENTARSFQELTLQKVMNGHCGPQDSQLALLVVDSAERAPLVAETLKGLPARFKDSPINYYYLDKAAFPFRDSLPTEKDSGLFIIKPKRGRFVEYSGPLTVQAAEEWVGEVLAGNGRFKAMAGPLREAGQKGEL